MSDYSKNRLYGKEWRDIRNRAFVNDMLVHIRCRIDYFLSLGFARNNITIFVSKTLRDFLEAYTQYFKYNEQANSPKFYITLLGCPCETYLDNKLSFYVTTDQKAEGWQI